MTEVKLPPSILDKASLRANEYAWRLADVAEAINAAQTSGLATLGGQIQFRTPDGICELYWLSATAEDRRPDEDWLPFVSRSAEQVLQRFVGLVATTDFVAEGLRHFPCLAELQSRGDELAEYLCFVLYFQDPAGEAHLRQLHEDLMARERRRR
jgi:hypothetical protein